MLATERWLGLLGVRVREGRIRVGASVHSRVIGPDIARVGGVRAVRAVCEKDAKGGNTEGLMGPVYAFMRCVDNAAVARAETRSKHVTFCLTKHRPIRQAHIWLNMARRNIEIVII